MPLQADAAYLIAVAGALGVYWELARPGRFLPGLVGLGLLTWGSYELSRYQVNPAALALTFAGLLILLAETIWSTRGIAALCGWLCLGLGSARMLTGTNALSGVFVWPLSGVFAGTSFLLAKSARRARENKRRDLEG